MARVTTRGWMMQEGQAPSNPLWALLPVVIMPLFYNRLRGLRFLLQEAEMSKLYAQQTELVLSSSGVIAPAGSISGSLVSQGHAKLVGLLYSSMSAAGGAGSGLHVLQSSDYGANWDIISGSYPIKAVTASGFSIDVVGNAVKVQIWNGASSASVFRTNWYLRPL